MTGESPVVIRRIDVLMHPNYEQYENMISPLDFYPVHRVTLFCSHNAFTIGEDGFTLREKRISWCKQSPWNILGSSMTGPMYHYRWQNTTLSAYGSTSISVSTTNAADSDWRFSNIVSNGTTLSKSSTSGPTRWNWSQSMYQVWERGELFFSNRLALFTRYLMFGFNILFWVAILPFIKKPSFSHQTGPWLHERGHRHLRLDWERHLQQLQPFDDGWSILLRSSSAVRSCGHFHVLHWLHWLCWLAEREHLSTLVRMYCVPCRVSNDSMVSSLSFSLQFSFSLAIIFFAQLAFGTLVFIYREKVWSVHWCFALHRWDDLF